MKKIQQKNHHLCVLSANNIRRGHSSEVSGVSPLMPPSSISYKSQLFQGSLVIIVDLYHDTGSSWLHSASWAQVGQMGSPRFSSPVPFWEDRLAGPKCCPFFPGWEEVKHEGRERGRQGDREGLLPKSKRGEGIDVWWQSHERWVTLTLRSHSTSLASP